MRQMITARLPSSNNRLGNYQAVIDLRSFGPMSKETRVARLKLLIDERFEGKAARLAHALDMKPPQLHRWLKARQGVSEDSARAIEEKLGLPNHWLDEDAPYRTTPEHPVATEVREPDPRLYNVMTVESIRHHLPIISAEQIMEGVSPDRHDAEFMARVPTDSCYAGPASRHAFIFRAEDENMAGGDLHIGKGYFAVIEPNAEADPEDVVLVRIGGRRPVLRRLSEGGDALYLVAERGRFDPVRFDETTCQIIGVVLTAYPRPRSPRMKDSSA